VDITSQLGLNGNVKQHILKYGSLGGSAPVGIGWHDYCFIIYPPRKKSGTPDKC